MNDASCPHCGERLLPVLHRASSAPERGPLVADSPVRLECPQCGPPSGETAAPGG